MVIASAGRRIDAQDAKEARFPLRREKQVAEQIHAALEQQKATALVCSAACGSDILALEAARQLGIRCRVVLPFDRKKFRETSVVDRPGDWGGRYDEILNELEKEGDVIVLEFDPKDSEAYTATNDHILSEATVLARETGSKLGVLIVWDGKPRGDDDVTAQLLNTARDAGLFATELSTL